MKKKMVFFFVFFLLFSVSCSSFHLSTEAMEIDVKKEYLSECY